MSYESEVFLLSTHDTVFSGDIRNVVTSATIVCSSTGNACLARSRRTAQQVFEDHYV